MVKRRKGEKDDNVPRGNAHIDDVEERGMNSIERGGNEAA